MIDQIDEIIDRLDDFETEKNSIIGHVLGEQSEAMVSEVRRQLWNGLTGDLTPIVPSYLNDTYFKSKEEAYRYMMWKQRITPNPRRPIQTPNLFINGYFHSSLFLSIGEDSAEVTSMVPLGDEIISKYGKDMFGVNEIFIEREIVPLVKDRLIAYLHGNI